MGLTGVEVAKKLIELLDLPLTWEEYFRLAHEQYKTLMPSAQLMPGMFDINVGFDYFRHGKHL